MLIVRDATTDYANRDYLSVVEVATYAGLPVREIHRRVKSGELAAFKSAGGQYRFRLRDVTPLRAAARPSADDARRGDCGVDCASVYQRARTRSYRTRRGFQFADLGK